jgi:hypothetical protein
LKHIAEPVLEKSGGKAGFSLVLLFLFFVCGSLFCV